jgi:recombination protein RecA
MGLVEKSGAWFSFGADRIGQGRENAKTYLEQHPAAMDKLEGLILQKHNILRGGRPAASAPEAEAPKKSEKPELAPDGKPVVKLAPQPAPKNGVAKPAH